MSLLSSILAEEAPAPILAPPWVFAVIAAAIFLTLALVSWSYRDVANRHSDKTGTTEDADHGHGHH